MALSSRNVVPMSDWILIQNEDNTKTEGGLHVPDVARASFQKRGAKVVAVGPGRVTETGHRHEPKVKVGDYVWLDQNPTIALLPFMKDAVLVREHSVVCTISPDRE